MTQDAPQFRLRRCAPGDEPRLSLIGQATFLEAFAGILEGADILLHCQKQHAPQVYAGWLQAPHNRIYIAEAGCGAAPLGYVAADDATLPIPGPSPLDYEVKRIYLLHRFQGLGIGRALMNAAAETARELGRTRLVLGVYSGNHAAIEFYKHWGFSKIGGRRFLVGATLHEDVILGCVL